MVRMIFHLIASSQVLSSLCTLLEPHQKTKIMESGPITSWEIDGETVETVSDFIFGGFKITQMVIAPMKLKKRKL